MKAAFVIGALFVLAFSAFAFAFHVDSDDDPRYGPRVTLIEFGGFVDPFSRAFYQNTLPLIKENFIDTGRVTYVFRDFSLPFHRYSHLAAEASECADEQGEYWRYHNRLFDDQSWTQAVDKQAAITQFVQYADQLGLNTQEFSTCLISHQMASEVDDDIQDGENAGVSGTPYFFIQSECGEEQLFVGNQPYEEFEAALNAVLDNCPRKSS